MSETEHEDATYLAGGESPVSGVTHLFSSEQVAATDPATSLCGAVGSYGPFRTTTEVAEGEVCKNCERVREQRENTENDDA